jgi:hypothetical protein
MFDGTGFESFWELAIARGSVSQNRYVPFFQILGNRFRVRFLTLVSFSIRGRPQDSVSQ